MKEGYCSSYACGVTLLFFILIACVEADLTDKDMPATYHLVVHPIRFLLHTQLGIITRPTAVVET